MTPRSLNLYWIERQNISNMFGEQVHSFCNSNLHGRGFWSFATEFQNDRYPRQHYVYVDAQRLPIRTQHVLDNRVKKSQVTTLSNTYTNSYLWITGSPSLNTAESIWFHHLETRVGGQNSKFCLLGRWRQNFEILPVRTIILLHCITCTLLRSLMICSPPKLLIINLSSSLPAIM